MAEQKALVEKLLIKFHLDTQERVALTEVPLRYSTLREVLRQTISRQQNIIFPIGVLSLLPTGEYEWLSEVEISFSQSQQLKVRLSSAEKATEYVLSRILEEHAPGKIDGIPWVRDSPTDPKKEQGSF